MTGIDRQAPQVKICGIRETDTIAQMNGLPVAYIGFVFAPSKRQVTAEQAAKLHAASRVVMMNGDQPPRTVGVFVNPTLDELADVLRQVPLDVVQLHGQETPAFCREVGKRFGVEVWRALPAEAEADDAAGQGPQRLTAYEGAVAAVLIDTAGGGTGRTFRWDLIPAYRDQAGRSGFRFMVAGGLTPDNVAELLSAYEIDGVDTSSGVETDGVKDINKIAAFAERVNRS